jgi:hypothetical protein
MDLNSISHKKEGGKEGRREGGREGGKEGRKTSEKHTSVQGKTNPGPGKIG